MDESRGSGHSDTDTYSIDTKQVVYGDLSGNGQLAALVLVDENGGGSGIFRSVIAVWKANGTLMNSEQKELGDRVVINSIAIADRVVTMDMLTQGPNDGMCCPTQHKLLRFALQGNRLVDVE